MVQKLKEIGSDLICQETIVKVNSKKLQNIDYIHLVGVIQFLYPTYIVFSIYLVHLAKTNAV